MAVISTREAAERKEKRSQAGKKQIQKEQEITKVLPLLASFGTFVHIVTRAHF